MMEIAHKIRTWGENDRLIICHRAIFQSSYTNCELCGWLIVALAESRSKAKQTGWHLVCHDCFFNEFFPEIQRQGRSVKMAGRFGTEEEARKVLPK